MIRVWLLSIDLGLCWKVSGELFMVMVCLVVSLSIFRVDLWVSFFRVLLLR